jgi:polysaccharide pyruvyl transferase WcaK-like protein
MPSPLRVLHLASFAGNIGDNANHMGFHPWFENQCDRPVEWTRLEMREFYWKQREWDADLVDTINSYDAMVIGGGNYFELWVDHSPTGTSVAIPPELFEKVTTPIFFNALGVDPGQGVSEVAQKRFRQFLDIALASNKHIVSVRNDGAKNNLKTHIGAEYAEQIHRLPDHGFFVPPPKTPDHELTLSAPMIAINLACDMADLRFGEFGGMKAFCSEISTLCEMLSKEYEECTFTLVPHIYSDLEIITNLIGQMPDDFRRTRICVAPLGSGDEAAMTTLAHYKTADLVFGMRFHSNVCSFAMNRPVLGLSSYPQIKNLYDEIDQADQLIDIKRPGFSEPAFTKAESLLNEANKQQGMKSSVLDIVTQQRQAFEPALKAWMNNNSL